MRAPALEVDLTALCAEIWGFFSGVDAMSFRSCRLRAVDFAREVSEDETSDRWLWLSRIASQYQHVHSEYTPPPLSFW